MSKKRSREESKDEEDSCFAAMDVRQRMTLLPSYIGRISEGVLEHLNKKVLRYSHDLNGVFLSYTKPLVLQQAGRIIDEHPHIHFDLEYRAYVFKPRVGSVLSGVVNNIGDDHIGCLVYDCFNASVVMSEEQRNSHNRTFLSNCDIGSEIQFCVTQLEIIAGIVSIRGELLDSSSLIHRRRKRRKSEKLSQDEESQNSFILAASAASSSEQVPKIKKKKKSKHKEN